jgi:hypothetical protein
MVVQHRMLRTTSTRRVQRHQHHAVAVVAVGIGAVVVGIAAQHDEQLAVRVRRAGDEPLAAVEHQCRPPAPCARASPHGGLQLVGRTRPRRARSSQSRADWPCSSGCSHLGALRGAGKAVQQLDVAGVGALQLNTSAAQGRRPMASASGA